MSITRLMQMSTAGKDLWVEPDLANATVTSPVFSIPVDTGFGQNSGGFWVSRDGLNMMYLDASNEDYYYFTMATAFDFSTLTKQSRWDPNIGSTVHCITSSEDGKTFWLGTLNNGIYQVSLGTSFSINTYTSAPFIGFGFDVMAIRFNNDGSILYIDDGNSSSIKSYLLSTPYNVFTAGSLLASFSYSSFLSGNLWGNGFYIAPTGKRIYLIGYNSNFAYQVDLSTPWDLSTGVYNSVRSPFLESLPLSISFNENGTEMYTGKLYNGSNTIRKTIFA